MTLKELAAQVGCSPSTLDRVLHNRGSVSAKTRARILESVSASGFQINSAGKALAMQNKMKFGIIISADFSGKANSLFPKIYEGMRCGVEALSQTGAEFYFRGLKSGTAAEQVQEIQSLIEAGAAAIAISFEDDDHELHEAIERGIQKGVKFIPYYNTCPNRAIEHKFIFDMGIDQVREGRVAAELMARFLGGRGKIVLFSGLMRNRVHQNRIDAVYDEIKKNHPGITVVDVIRNAHPLQRITRQLEEVLENCADLAGVIASCGNNWAIGDILQQRGLCGQVVSIMFDKTLKVEEQLKAGVIDCVIGQDLKKLGYNTVLALYDSLMLGSVDSFKVRLPMLIEIKQCY